MFTRLVIEAKFRRMYTCASCNRQQEGDTESMSIDRTHTSGVKIKADAIRPNPHRMPVGWASFLSGIRCAGCL